jgi:hypothetical protein
MRALRNIAVLFLVAVANPATPGEADATASVPILQQYLQRGDFSWKAQKTKNFLLYFEADSEASQHVSSLKRNVELDRMHVLRLISEADYHPTIHAFFLKSGPRMKELVGVEVDGRSRPVQHAVFSVVTKDRLHLTHELCHEIASNLWGAAEPWIEEGLAVYAADGDNIYFEAWSLLDTGRMAPLEKLVTPEWNSAMYSPDVTYPELGAFLKYLNDAYGVARVKQAWQSGAAGLEAAFGKPLPALEQDYHDALVRQFPSRPTRHYRSSDGGFGLASR